ncbi:MAG: beta-lactamase family protein [Gemmatimonadota bacterium]|nr:MAG: beta-lactamase family protein [Gemmatimonadota bacterium]
MRLVTVVALCSVSVSCRSPSGADLPLPWGDPADAGFSAERLERIRPAMQRYVDEGLTGGIVTMVARRGLLVHWETVGFRNIERQQALQLDDLFRICSMSKPITSVAVMMLVEDGEISLDDPVSQYLPALEDLRVYSSDGPVPLTSAITIEDLLKHTSGFTYGPFGETPVDTLYRRADVFSGDLQNLVEEVGELPLLGQPGSIWNYGVSTDVLGRVVEVVSGQPLDEFLKLRVFAPLGMQDTDFFVPPEKSSRFTTVYSTAADSSLVEGDASICGSYSARPPLLLGGGGLVSTAHDYIRFAQMLLNGGELDGHQLLSPETVDLMSTNRLPDELVPIRIGEWVVSGYGFGLGFSVLTDADATPVPDNNGVFRWLGYAATYFWIDPAEELIGLAMTQLAPNTHPELEAEFQTLVYEALEN